MNENIICLVNGLNSLTEIKTTDPGSNKTGRAFSSYIPNYSYSNYVLFFNATIIQYNSKVFVKTPFIL